jgi:hypothetical protein
VIDRAAIFFFDMECGFIVALFLCSRSTGVADHLLAFNERVCFRVIRKWLKGKWTGVEEDFTTNLPGFPDEITQSSDGNYTG